MSAKAEIKEHPILTIFIAVLSTAIMTFATTTFATMGYVDKKLEESKGYTKEKYQTIENDIKEIKASIKEINNNILKLYIKIK